MNNWHPLCFNQVERIGIVFLLLQIIKDGNNENSFPQQQYLDILIGQKLGIIREDVVMIQKIASTSLPISICNELMHMGQDKKYALLIMMLKMAQVGRPPLSTVKNKVEQFVSYFNLPHTDVEIKSILNYKEIGCYYTTSYGPDMAKDIEIYGFNKNKYMTEDEL